MRDDRSHCDCRSERSAKRATDENQHDDVDGNSQQVCPWPPPLKIYMLKMRAGAAPAWHATCSRSRAAESQNPNVMRHRQWHRQRFGLILRSCHDEH